MKVDLKCFAGLAEEKGCGYEKSATVEMPAGATVGMMMHEKQIPDKAVRIVFVNGKITHEGHVLHEGDRVALAPAIGGM
ncbi:MAG: MoaD/ThiS family protein [Desulfatitalea sp.]|nr:MoaD/ThiS family protein [Desulfatitalea sp.]